MAYTYAFNNMVKLAGTAKLRVESLSAQHAMVYLPNHRSIQNHIGGLHACSMTLAAESATGLVVGMNVPDTHIPLIKCMKVNFLRRCQGGVRATSHLSDDEYRRIHEDDRGEVSVKVVVEDDSGHEPIHAEMIWAWVSKERKPKSLSEEQSEEERSIPRPRL
jgi:acyl-coenzyme A thioesterase PaaI-like protein